MKNKLLIIAGILAFACLGMNSTPYGSAGQVWMMAQNGLYANWVDPAPATIWVTGLPVSSLGANGTTAFDKSTGNAYYKSAGVWTLQMNIKGAQGNPGAVGLTGAAGPPGPAGAQGTIGPAGPQGLQGIAGQQGPAGSSGTTNLPVSGNNFDILQWYNGQYVLLPANPIYQQDFKGLTAPTALGYKYIDSGWQNYSVGGVVNVNALPAGSTVTLSFVYTDNNNVLVTLAIPITALGQTKLADRPITVTNVSPFNNVSVNLVITGTANVDITPIINTAP